MHRQLIYVPIEPLTERYTEQWYRRFPLALNEAGFEVMVIEGQPLVTDDIHVGTFLDINSTIAYKASQMQKLASLFQQQRVRENAVIFFGDLEFWGIESVRLMADMNGLRNVKLAAFLHAASYTHEDAFAIAEPYQKYTEVGWLAAMDKVFVGSEYHRRAVSVRRLSRVGSETLGKIIVTKNPVFVDEYPLFAVKRKPKILLTNRLDDEKRPVQTLELFARLKEAFPDRRWEYVVTTSRKTLRSNDPEVLERVRAYEEMGLITVKVGLTKEKYHRELAESAIMVSHSIEENYGYCIAEALHYGVCPLLKNCASHPEFVKGYEDRLLFDSEQDAFRKASALMEAFDSTHSLPVPELDTSGLSNIVHELMIL